MINKVYYCASGDSWVLAIFEGCWEIETYNVSKGSGNPGCT